MATPIHSEGGVDGLCSYPGPCTCWRCESDKNSNS